MSFALHNRNQSDLITSCHQVTILVSTVIRLPVGTLGDLYEPVNVQFAGIYPIVVLLLVNHERSLDKTIFVNSVAMHAEGMDQSGSEDSAAGRERRANMHVSSLVFQSTPSMMSRTRTANSSTMESGDTSPSMHMDAELEEKVLTSRVMTVLLRGSESESEVIEIKTVEAEHQVKE